MRTTQVGLLARHFFWRFLDNDLISPDTDVHETGGLLLTFLAVPSLLGTALLLFMYANPYVTPYERMMLSLGDKFGYIAWSMLVMALVTIVDWDALALDARDYAILGSLPVSPLTLLAGKLAALACFVTAIVVAVNLVPTLFFPPVYMSSTAAHVPLRLGGWMVLGHAVSCVGAAVFAFLSVLALRSLLLLVLGPRLFRRVSLPAQVVTAMALVIAFFNVSSLKIGRGDPAAYLSPPMWFLGLYEVICERMAPGMPPATTLLKWQVAREQQARASYTALQPVFHDLAFIAVVALAVAALVAFALYFAGHFGHASGLRQGATAQPISASAFRRWLERLVSRYVVSDSLAQATFFFTWKTLTRSARHKLFLAGYLGAGALFVYTVAAPLVTHRPAWLTRGPSVAPLSLQFVLSFFLLVGLRAVFAIPAELRANWVFRLTTAGRMDRHLAGLRRMVAACVVVPLFVALVPLHALLWGWGVASLHGVFGILWSLVLVEVLLVGFDKLPFTCSHVAGKGNLKMFWPVSVFAFIIYAYAFTAFERSALTSVTRACVLAFVICAILGLASALRRRELSNRSEFVFEELPDAVPVRLDL